MDVRHELHSLVDQLGDDQTADAVTLLRELVGEDGPRHIESVGRSAKPMHPRMVSGHDFFAASHLDLAAPAAQQGTQPVPHFEGLLGDFWPEEETPDEFIAAVRGWRREGGCA